MSNRRKPTMGDVPANGTLWTPGGSRLQVPEGWADEPRPSLHEHVVAYCAGMAEQRNGQLHNAYVCDTCRQAAHTVDAHPGVTPSSLAHKSLRPSTTCEGRAWSSGYPQGDPPASLGPATHEWYRPSMDELASASPDVQHHVEQGGLLLRLVTT